MDNPFYIVDVFAVEKYAGNQLAVVLNAEGLSDKEMQKIAREMNYSETTFVLSDTPKDGGYNVRIFTPENELPFAGHPTLGTAYVIEKHIVQGASESIKLNLKVGQIPVTFSKDKEEEILWMRQIQPTFGQKFYIDQLAEILSLAEAEIDERYPIEEVSTGLPFIIVPVKTLAAIKKAKLNQEKFYKLIEKTEAKDILVFCPETYCTENNLNVRVFVPYEGIPEDPATGSANGCLAAYLVRQKYFNESAINIRVEQGYEINRPSLLFLKAAEGNEETNIEVGGQVILVAKGELV